MSIVSEDRWKGSPRSSNFRIQVIASLIHRGRGIVLGWKVEETNRAVQAFGGTPAELLDRLAAWRPPALARPWLDPSQT